MELTNPQVWAPAPLPCVFSLRGKRLKIRIDTTHDLRDMECNCQLDCTSENAKATAANRSLFLKPTGLVIKTCNLVMSVVKNETVSTAHGSECYPCAGCHAMYECCPQFFGLLLGELSRESIQHFDTPHLRIFPNPNVVKACKLAFWLCGVASIPRHEKFCLANIPLAFVLTSFWNPCTEKIVSQVCHVSE